MKKRFIAILLTVALVISYLPGDIPFFSTLSVNAETSGDYSYKVLSDGTVEITGYTGTATEVAIPGTIDGKAVTSIGKYAFRTNPTPVSIIIPDGVNQIGECAFMACQNLISVTIPGSVTSLNEWGSFYSCQSLESVTMLDGVTSIGASTFDSCVKLKNITFPDSILEIRGDAFYNTAWYDNQPDGLLYVGKVAYKYKGTMPEDTSITLKEGTTCITDNAFQSCTNLIEVTIPHSVTFIATAAFGNCKNLGSITIPDSVTTISDYTFQYCSNLSDITIPSSVTSIGKYAFENCTSLFSITIPSSVTSIGEKAFNGCTYLTSVTIPDSVISIGKNAFFNDSCIIYCYPGTAADTYVKAMTNGIRARYLIDKYPTTLATTSYTYDGTAKTPEVIVEGLTKGKNYLVAYTNNTNAGTATVTIKGVVNYGGTITKTFTINPSSIKDFSATLSTTSYTYDGKTKEPEVTVKDGENTLVLGKDYTVSYANNTNAGTATVTITGIGNYGGTITKTFTINPGSIDGLSATLSTTEYTYDGKAKEPEVTVKHGENTLTLGTDYTVSYANNINPGIATVTITGTGNYTGTITKTFTITAQSISDLTATLSATEYTYNGKAKKPSVTLKHGTKVLVLNKDYTVTYVANTNPGTATVILKGKGNYTGTLKKTYAIKMATPKLSLTAGKKKVTIKWGKVTGASGYEVFMSTSKSGKYKGIKSANQKTYTFTKTGLTKGKTYYFKVRTYKKVNGKKVYSTYSSIKSVKVK